MNQVLENSVRVMETYLEGGGYSREDVLVLLDITWHSTDEDEGMDEEEIAFFIDGSIILAEQLEKRRSQWGGTLGGEWSRAKLEGLKRLENRLLIPQLKSRRLACYRKYESALVSLREKLTST